jgi:hypothetical protein
VERGVVSVEVHSSLLVGTSTLHEQPPQLILKDAPHGSRDPNDSPAVTISLAISEIPSYTLYTRLKSVAKYVTRL